MFIEINNHTAEKTLWDTDGFYKRLKFLGKNDFRKLPVVTKHSTFRVATFEEERTVAMRGLKSGAPGLEHEREVCPKCKGRKYLVVQDARSAETLKCWICLGAGYVLRKVNAVL